MTNEFVFMTCRNLSGRFLRLPAFGNRTGLCNPARIRKIDGAFRKQGRTCCFPLAQTSAALLQVSTAE